MTENNPVRIIVDTNLWISFVISDKYYLLDDLLYENKVILLISKDLIREIHQTISKPKLKRFFKDGALDKMLSVFEPFMELVEVSSSINTCRDPKDDFLLALARDGGADFLLTADKDLLELKCFGATKIVTISGFIQEANNLASEGPGNPPPSYFELIFSPTASIPSSSSSLMYWTNRTLTGTSAGSATCGRLSYFV